MLVYNEKIVANSSGLLSAVLNTIADGVMVIDDHGVIQGINPAAVRLFGYTRDELVGNNVNMLMPQPYHSEHDSYIKNYLNTGIAKIIGIGREVSAQHKQGHVFPVELCINEMQVGAARMFVGSIRDISQRKEAEEALRKSEERYQLAVQGLSVGIWDWDTTTNSLFWSRRFREIIGAREGELEDTYEEWESRLHPMDRDATVKKLFDHLRHLCPYDVEYRLRRSDNRYIWIHAKGQAVWNERGEAVRMVGSIEDITWRKTSENNLKKALEELKQSNEELESFAYIASHDLKEPLRGLANNATMLKEDCAALDATAQKRLNRMIFLCQRMERLVDDLLYFSRLGRQEMAIKEADLNQIIRDIESLMETTLHEQNGVIVLPKPLPVVRCDLPRITEVFRNLITNAVKYNRSPQKHVEIGCVEKDPGGQDSGLIFYVRDNGIGISPEFYQDIFRIFKRLNEEEDGVKGTGVGLTFVKKIVERHGGHIWLESKPGLGTTFYFTIASPIKEEDTNERPAAIAAGGR